MEKYTLEDIIWAKEVLSKKDKLIFKLFHKSDIELAERIVNIILMVCYQVKNT